MTIHFDMRQGLSGTGGIHPCPMKGILSAEHRIAQLLLLRYHSMSEITDGLS